MVEYRLTLITYMIDSYNKIKKYVFRLVSYKMIMYVQHSQIFKLWYTEIEEYINAYGFFGNLLAMIINNNNLLHTIENIKKE